MPADQDGRVLITGLGVICSTAADPDAFAAALRAGASGIVRRTDHPDPDLPDSASPDWALRPSVRADLPPFDLGEALAARSVPVRRATTVAAARSPLAVRVSAAVAAQAWESAALHEGGLPAERVGLVVAGHNLGGRYADQVRPRFESSPAHLSPRYALQFMDTDHVGTVSQALGITGEGYTVGGASASGNVALANGWRMIVCGAVDACLVLGALTDLSDLEMQGFYNLGAMAGADGRPPDRCARPFDAGRDGFVPGQGAACVVLESAASAAQRRALAHGRVAGFALRLDGNALADPDLKGEVATMRDALRHAGLTPDQIGYVNAHATGSVLGDEIELAALHAVFGGCTDGPWVNSTKGLVGHCLCAAGVVEAVATVLQLRDGFAHPNANLHRPADPRCRLVGAAAQPVSAEYALSNGFGFGGFSTSVVLARADAAAPGEQG